MGTKKVIDVSYHNGTIDWEKVKTLSPTIADAARKATPRVTFYGAPAIAGE